jgi:hypothetical protein
MVMNQVIRTQIPFYNTGKPHGSGGVHLGIDVAARYFIQKTVIPEGPPLVAHFQLLD